MKYQSEIIKEIIDMRGHDKSSLHYESECIESWIDENKGAYPKLCDYQSEWLNYINENPLGEFPYETLTDVTKATINNVVPYAYKSAILKGQTLVNLVGEKREYINSGSSLLYGWEFMLPYKLTSGKTYLAIFDVSGTIDESNSKVYLMDNKFGATSGNTSSAIPTFSLGHNVVKCIATNDNHKVLRIRTTYNENEKFMLSNVMLIEYQEGMENWDIPYFESMQSVKMPVLTTSNEDGTKSNILSTPSDLELRGIGDVKDELNLLTGEVVERIGEIVLNEDITGYQDTNYSTNAYSAFRVTSITNIPNTLKNVICDKVKYYPNFGLDWTKQEEFFTINGNLLFIKILSTKASNFEELRTFLSSSPITIQYELTESVKTVELTITNQDGETLSTIKPLEGTMHITTSGTPINPLFSGEIPVEAITQNLASFIEE